MSRTTTKTEESVRRVPGKACRRDGSPQREEKEAGVERFLRSLPVFVGTHRTAIHSAVFIVYLAVAVTVMCFHEPWFDEAQAWLIARDCSWRELLTVRTHYEGHPPLWWMLLAVPAKLGMPYEWGLKGVQLLTAALMIWLLEFRTKLPEILKVIMPFSYFLCYQYGVTSRPYALMIAAMFLVAINWKNRDEKPWPVVLSMMLLCLTSSYGIVIAGLFSVLWVFDFIRSDKSLFLNKGRFFALLALLVLAICLIYAIRPIDGTSTGAIGESDDDINSPAIRYLYIWLLLPSETMFTSYTGDSSLETVDLSAGAFLYAAAISIMVWCVIGWICRRRNMLRLLLVPYVVLSVIFMMYFSMHHEGIILGYFLMILTIACDVKELGMADVPRQLLKAEKDVAEKIGNSKFLWYKAMLCCAGLSVMFIGVYWNVSACACDIKYDYSSSRYVASFIKDNDLEKYKWMSGWSRITEGQANAKVKQMIRSGEWYCAGEECVDFTPWIEGTLLISNPYFKSNLIGNSYENQTYLSWEWMKDPQRARKDIERWRSSEEPEFYSTIYQPFYFSDLGYKRNDYIKFHVGTRITPWKDSRTKKDTDIYIRKDIYRGVLHSPDAGIKWSDGSKIK